MRPTRRSRKRRRAAAKSSAAKSSATKSSATKSSAAKSSAAKSSAAKSSAANQDIALAAFAHDIRTALNGILAFGELLASSDIGERERQWAAGIKTGAEHLAALTTLVVDAAKLEAGALTLQQEAFRPVRLLEAVAESLAVRAQIKGLEAEVDVADDLPDFLLGDAVRLRAALENLIDNAVKFTAQGAVRLEAQAKRAARGRLKLTVTVSDSGIGLTPAEMKHVFRPFAQASVDIARRYGGAGLGLATVKYLARAMGGDLTVASKPGRGARFCFSAVLPIAAATAEQQKRGGPIAAPARRLKILCAEDNPYGRVILNTILTELGHRADFVGSGEDAVEAVALGAYDAVLMDVMLPGVDGLEAARHIRALASAANSTPIIGISGRGEPGNEAAARAAGMDAYLRKPISPSALSEAIAAVMAKELPSTS
ncbi:MAG TPA: ATP-binding protein [Stellaceae bacterium]|nr:ATP-binding protein [Stellaceae bacterium]